MSTAVSFQNGPSAQGWNDCPIVHSSSQTNYHTRNRRKNHSASGSVVSIDTLDDLCTVKEMNIPRLPGTSPSIVTVSLEKRPSPSSSPVQDSVSSWSQGTVKEKLDKVLNLNSSLSDKEFQYHSAKLSNRDLLKNEENEAFLNDVLESFLQNDDIKIIETKIIDFMMSHAGISWCCSLKKILISSEN